MGEMTLTQAYRHIGIHVGDIIKWNNVLKDISYAQQIYLNNIRIEKFPNDTITSVRQQEFYNCILSLAKTPLTSNERNNMLKSFIKGIIKDDQQTILAVNKVIQETQYTELLLDTEDITKIDTDDLKKLSIDVIDSHIEKCKTKIINKDYTGAITNARSLLETVYLKIIQDNNGDTKIVSGDLTQMYSAIKKIFISNHEQAQLIQLFSGVASITNFIASLSNTSLADRHGHLDENNNKIYAELFVNLVFSISTFLIKNKK